MSEITTRCIKDLGTSADESGVCNFGNLGALKKKIEDLGNFCKSVDESVEKMKNEIFPALLKCYDEVEEESKKNESARKKPKVPRLIMILLRLS